MIGLEQTLQRSLFEIRPFKQTRTPRIRGAPTTLATL